MVFRRSATGVFIGLASLAGLSFAQTQTVSSNVFALPGASGAGPLYTYTANPFAPINTLAASSGTFQVLSKPNGSEFYAIANSGTTAVSAISSNFSSVQQIGGALSLGASAAALSPDGKRLVVATGSQSSGTGTIYLFDTSTDSLLLPNGIPVSGTPVDLAISLDSARVLVVGTTPSGTVLTTIDLGSFTVVATLQLPGGVTGVAVGPNGYGYVTAINRVFEVDPRNPGSVRNEIDVNGTPNRPVFTTDGQYAVSTNRTPAAGSSIVIMFDLVAHKVAGSVPNPTTSSLTLDSRLVVAGNNRIFATSSQTGSLYEITTSPLNANFSTLLNSALPTGVNIAAIAVSGEVPNGSAGARYLFVVANASGSYSIYRIDLTADSA
ncbi:MAG: YncE family protein, partial [Bryobacteraceae bacterium]